MQPLIEIHDAVVRRDGRNILVVKDFALQPGESVAILGPNGAGKSTFVGLITREVFPIHRDDPPVRFMGEHNISLEDIKLRIGFVSSSMQQQMRVHLPAIEIVQGGLFGSLGLPKRFTPTDEDFDKAFQIMKDLDIANIAYRDVMTLSSGQARRVLVARALVHDPEVLIFDEPTTGLDPAGMYHVRQNMSQIAQSGRSILLVTHYPEDIIAEMDRVVMIKDGEVFADGSKNELLTPEKFTELFGVPF